MSEATTRANESIVTFTPAARDRLLQILDQQGLRGKAALRIAIVGRSGSGFAYQMGLDADGQPEPTDVVQDAGEFKLLVQSDSAPKLTGATIDFEDQLMGGGFRIHNPNPVWDDPLAAAIQELVDNSINPSVASHGGVVELVDVQDNTVYLRLGGGCQGCGMVDVTLRQGIEVLVRREFPQVVGVVDVTDHAGGTSPYFQPAKGGTGPQHQPSKGTAGNAAGGCGHGGCPHCQPSKA
jgi:Fe/S biogenesis protein NfuA